jgi:hypothetical protein
MEFLTDDAIITGCLDLELPFRTLLSDIAELLRRIGKIARAETLVYRPSKPPDDN